MAEPMEQWDAVAVDYQRVAKLGLNEYNSRLLRFWSEKGMIFPGARFLDIGCGVGKYGVYMAELGCDVTLTDISGEMLRHAEENMARFPTPWAVYQCDFDKASGREGVFAKGFDLSISTMSPAVHDVATVQKMSAMTHGWCFLARFSSWRQPMRDEFLKLLGLPMQPPTQAMDKDCEEIIKTITAAGYTPEVEYVDYNWSDQRGAEDFADYMLRRTDALSGTDRDKALQCARAMSENGLINDAIYTRVAWIYWKSEGTDMIHDLYKKAGELHGHYCPGLAIGVRAAAIANERLGIEAKNKGLYCIAESSACYIDGIQHVFGTTVGNGCMKVLDRGKAAFNFYDRDNGKGLRLFFLGTPDGMSREDSIEYILTAPAEQVFSQTAPHFEAPEYVFKPQNSVKCAICGESCKENHMTRTPRGLVCPDCVGGEN